MLSIFKVNLFAIENLCTFALASKGGGFATVKQIMRHMVRNADDYISLTSTNFIKTPSACQIVSKMAISYITNVTL